MQQSSYFDNEENMTVKIIDLALDVRLESLPIVG